MYFGKYTFNPGSRATTSFFLFSGKIASININYVSMHINHRFLVVFSLTLCLILAGASTSREIPDGIVKSLATGNSRELSRHFNENIEMVVLTSADVYSKSQAELILRRFFSEYKPVKFELLHTGGKENSRFAIGNLHTDKGDFRIYFLIKQRDAVPLIHLLRIEPVE
jgi:hypothetical protein